MHRRRLKRFTKDEIALIRQLRSQGIFWGAIGARLGHSGGACQIALERDNHKAAQPATKPRHYWTDAQDRRLRELRRAGKKFREIDKELGLALGASCLRWQNLVGGHVRRAAFTNDIECPREMHRPKDIPVHRSPAAALLGDPLPGRSAFDRRQAGIPDPPAPVGQGNHGFSKKPTLPTMPWREGAP